MDTSAAIEVLHKNIALKRSHVPLQEVQCQTDPRIQLLVLLLSCHSVHERSRHIMKYVVFLLNLTKMLSKIAQGSWKVVNMLA